MDERSSHWIEHFLGTFEALTWHSELDVGVGMSWPIVLPAEAFSERLSSMTGVLVLLDFVEFVGETCEGLSLDHLADGVGGVR